jgi:hypothetical protein
MKYRYLNDDELSHFAEELKQFLIVNGIYNDEWVKINQENPDKARDLVGIFSDQILEKVYSNIYFLENRSEERCTVMHISKEKSELIILERKSGNSFPSFSTPENIHLALQNNLTDIQFFKASKLNGVEKPILIHQYLQQGFVPSDKEFWNSLVTLTE